MLSKLKHRRFPLSLIASIFFALSGAASVALSAQFALMRSGFDAFWSAGLIILFSFCSIVFLGAWYVATDLATALTNASKAQAMTRHSTIFFPLFLFAIFPLIPQYNRQNIFLQFLAVIAVLLAVVGFFIALEDWRQRREQFLWRLVARKAALTILVNLIVAVTALRAHDLYFLKRLAREIPSATLGDVSMKIRLAKAPGGFSWKIKAPERGILQVATIPNENLAFQPGPPLHYEIHIRDAGQDQALSQGEVDVRGIQQIKTDLSAFSGKTVTLRFQMREPLSPGSTFGRIHSLLEMWNRPWPEEGRAMASVMRAYWSEPIIYTPHETGAKSALLIIVDTLRADHVGCYGYEFDTTPAIDRLAASGVRFKQAISQAPWTVPSIASIYTGRLPSSHQVGVMSGAFPLGMSAQPSLVDLIRQNGYYTVGFFNNPFLSPALGMNAGFLESHNYSGSAREGAALALEWIKANEDKKFFCVLHFMDPHEPYNKWPNYCSLPMRATSKAEMKNPSELADARPNQMTAYDSEIAFADSQIGVFLDELKRLDILEDTLVVFTADHGEEFGEHGGYKHGHTLYDELVRVPLIFSFPPQMPSGNEVEAQVRLMDILPTVCELLQIDVDDGAAAGRSLVPMITGTDGKDLMAVSEFLFYGSEKKSIRSGTHKLIFIPSTGEIRLYDLSADPAEKKDLSNEQPNLRDELLELLKSELEKNRSRSVRKADVPVLDEKTKKSLKSLGYLN